MEGEAGSACCGIPGRVRGPLMTGQDPACLPAGPGAGPGLSAIDQAVPGLGDAACPLPPLSLRF